MEQHNVVSPDEWLNARLELVQQEKEMTRLRDAIVTHRRALPWVRMGKKYVFDAAEGPVWLSDLFDGRSQLIVKHYMMAPGIRLRASAAPSRSTTLPVRLSTYRTMTCLTRPWFAR
jgi:predicted dithiol-disulfide oxidoreductase (DUF899 family)